MRTWLIHTSAVCVCVCVCVCVSRVCVCVCVCVCVMCDVCVCVCVCVPWYAHMQDCNGATCRGLTGVVSNSPPHASTGHLRCLCRSARKWDGVCHVPAVTMSVDVYLLHYASLKVSLNGPESTWHPVPNVEPGCHEHGLSPFLSPSTSFSPSTVVHAALLCLPWQ
jgi:hypothetical protein